MSIFHTSHPKYVSGSTIKWLVCFIYCIYRKNVRLVSFNLGLEDSGLPLPTKYLQNKAHANT